MRAKLLFVFLMMSGFVTLSAQAQETSQTEVKYRKLKASLMLNTAETTEVKNIEISVSTELRIDTYGDPEIPQHGFFDYLITGLVSEEAQTCSFEVLLTQTDLRHDAHDEILLNRNDRSGVIKLCSGMSLVVPSVKALLLGNSIQVELKSAEYDRYLGRGTLLIQE